MTELQRRRRIELLILLILIIIGGILVSRIPAQTVKPALPPQPQTKAQISRQVRPATACRVHIEGQQLPVTPWEPCGKAHKQVQQYAVLGVWAWTERRTAKEKNQ